MDLNQFRPRTSSDIFVYRNLRDFEKVLFLEHQVKELIELLKHKNKHILKLTEQLALYTDNFETTRMVKALKAEITNNQRLIKKYKEQINELTK